MPILSHHAKEWGLLSSVSSDIVDLNVHSISDSVDIDKLLNRNTDRRWKHTFNCPGWYVKGINPETGEECWESCQFKPDEPRKDKEGKAIKYESILETRIAPLFLKMPDPNYWNKVREGIDPIVITEGAKKAGAGLSAGFPSISLPGVWNGQIKGRLHHFLKLYCQPGRRFYLAFDSDVMTKEGVQKALIRLARLLLEKNCNVSIVLFPGDEDKTGLDDYVQRQGADALRTLIEQSKTFEEWNNYLIDSTPKLSKRQLQIAKIKKIFSNRVKLMVRGNILLIDGKAFDANCDHIGIEEKYGTGVGRDYLNEVLLFLARQSAQDPVIDYLEECYDRYGETTLPMIEGMGRKYLGTEEPIYDTYLKKTLLAAVTRTIEPGCKHETACVLQGGQGIGKSTFWRVLGGDWFDDNMKDTTNDELMKLHTCWIEEWGEIDRVTGKKEANEIKQFLSVQNDKFRPPYGRMVVENPRRFIIVGSTNSAEFLQDSTGDRRFWVIPVKKKIDIAQLILDRDQLWAAAYALYKKGTEKIYLSPEEDKIRDEMNNPYRNDDPWEEIINKYLGDKTEIKMVDILTDALFFEPSRIDRRSQGRVSCILRAMGWQKIHTMAGKVWRKTQNHGSDGSLDDETLTVKASNNDPSPNNNGSFKGHNNQMGHEVSEQLKPNDPMTLMTHKNRDLDIVDQNKTAETQQIRKGDVVWIVNFSALAEKRKGKSPPDRLFSLDWRVTHVGHDLSWCVCLEGDGKNLKYQIPNECLKRKSNEK